MEHLHGKPKTFETELAYKSAKCYTLRQCGVITDPPQYIHTQHGVFFVAHTAIIVRTSKIASCLSQIFLILTGVSRDGRKITTTRNYITISFGARRNRCKTDRIAFFNFKNIHFNDFQTQALVACLPFADPLCETGN